MQTSVDTRSLRCFVARIGSTDGRRTLGTGFFAAPGWAVTCAHVVQAASTVRVVPADQQADAVGTEWDVVAQSGPPVGGSALWPYPDLAILRARTNVRHCCALVEAGDPAGDSECHAWGFARREDGIDPVGAPASFTFEGVTGDGFLQLKLGQAAPGLSGAPLVCPSRRAVLGVVSGSRATRSDLGGWAVPISALLAGGQDVPDDVAECGRLIRSANLPAVISNRQQWNAVLPVDAGDVLDRPWAPWSRGPLSSPASLLRADFGVVPYLFRDTELTEAAAWCEDADEATPMAVMRVAAPGGAGKTRFAIRLCQSLDKRGWITGFWHDHPGLHEVPLPRLVVIDYAEETQAASLKQSLDLLARHATALAPVRVLLLTRAASHQARDALSELQQSGTATLTRVLDASLNNPVADTPLTSPQRADLYYEAVSSFTQAWCPAASVADRAVVDLSDGRYRLALEVLFEALDQALISCGDSLTAHAGTGPEGSGDRSPVGRALTHEEDYWQVTAPPSLRGEPELLRQCVGLATLAGAASHIEADSLLSIPPPLIEATAAPERQKLISWLRESYTGPAMLNPLRPDRLGEALAARPVS